MKAYTSKQKPRLSPSAHPAPSLSHSANSFSGSLLPLRYLGVVQILALFVLGLFTPLASGQTNLVPYPSSISSGGGTYNYSNDTRILYGTRSGVPRSIERTLQPLAQVFAGELEQITGIAPSVQPLAGRTPDSNDIVLNFSSVSGSFAVTEAEENQTYRLRVSSSGVSITSQYYKGVAYGTATLMQLLQEGAGGSFSASGTTINDSPAASFRNIMLDLARQPHSIEVIEDVVRAARMYKIRYVQLHLTDNEAFTFPFGPITNNLTDNRTYTRQQLVDLVTYADARGVTLIPELDLPGHSRKVKDSGYLSPNDGSDTAVASPANYGRITAVIDDMLSVFQSTPYFHIGGDESGAGSALAPFLGAMNDHLRGNPTGGKRRMLVWEGFIGSPTSDIPAVGDDRVVVVAWEHKFNTPWNLLQTGYQVVNASWKPMYVVNGWGGNMHPGATSGRKFDIADIYRWNKDSFGHWEVGNPVYLDRGPNDPVRNDGYWEAGYINRQNQVLGGQMCFWEGAESGILHQLRSRIPAMSERLWNPNKGDSFGNFSNRAQAVEDRMLTIIQPIEVLPFTREVDGYESIEDVYHEYQGTSLPVTMRNRTKLSGSIRYEQRNGRGSFDGVNFAPPNVPTSSSSRYTGSISFPDGFSIRAKLFRSDGTVVGGETWMRYNNWEPRVEVIDYDIGRTNPSSIPNMENLPSSSVIREYTLPFFRGALRHNRVIGQKIESNLTVPTTGRYTIFLKSQHGNADLYIDTNFNGTWESSEKLIMNTPSTEEIRDVNIDLTAGREYRIRVDHLAKLPRPALIMSLTGPGISNQRGISEFLSLPATGPTGGGGTPPPPATATTGVNFQRWNGIGGSTIPDLTNAPAYPNSPDESRVITTTETPSNAGSDFGVRIFTWLTAPSTGDYTFWIASDDNGELRLSTDANQANARLIANVPNSTAPQEWGKFPEQRSGTISLVAGQQYYLEALMKEGGGGDNLALAWSGPGFGQRLLEGSVLRTAPSSNPTPPPTATTGVNFQRWNGIGGSTIPDLTNAPAYPNSPDESRVITTTETPSNAGSDFGVRIFTWLTAPSTGDYTFWIASDDNGELRLSTDANQANARLIANVPNSTAPQEWGKFPEQRSGTISLVAGQQYYLEALMKEGGGGDNLALAWSGPGFGQRLLEGSVLRTAPSSNPTPPPTATTGVNFQRWNGIGGSTIPDLTNAPAYPNSPDESRVITTTETPSNAGSDFGVRIFTWLTAPSTGDYTFWIASDDNGELRLSTDANQANVRLIANVPNSTAPQEWGKFPEQRSGTISLVAGQQYYLEALMKEGGGGDNLALAWSGPGFGQRLLEGSVLRTAPSSNPTPPPTATTGVNFQRWNGIGGSTIPDLTNAPAYPNSPDESRVITTTETPSNAGSDFGVRIFTWLTAPSTGDYTFWIASDDNGELRLSTDANQANVRLIANVPNSTAPQEWGKFPEQRSGTISLVAGQQYYLEALMKESGGGDNLALAWSGPGFGQRLLEGSVLRTAPSSNPTPPPTATAGVNFQRWNGIGGSTIPDLTNAPAYPNSPDESQVITTTEIPSNTGNDFGVRIFTWLTAPSTGDYTFWIASDDNGELRLSTDANQANGRLIANVPNWTSPQEWDKFPEQRSGTISLVAGQQYYLEALMKESGGGDNLALAWSGPGFGQRLLEGSALRTAPSGGSTSGGTTSGGTTSGGTTSGGTTSGGTTSGGSAGSPNFAQTRVNSVSNQSWTSVDLGQNYSSAVIVASPLYANNSTPPVVARVRNVSGSGFQVKLDRADGQTGAVNLDVSIIAVEEGVYTQAADGVKMEAVKYTSSVTAGKGSWTSESRSYQNSYTNPVVVGQVMSANDADWSVFWSRGVNRASAPNSGNLNVGKQVASDPDRTRANETIGYIVIESGSGNIAGRGYSAGLGSDTVQGVVNSSTGYSYNVSGLSSASAAAVSISGIDGGDGGWAVLFGSDAISASTLKVAVDEDQLGDSERRHTTEQVSYLIFE